MLRFGRTVAVRARETSLALVALAVLTAPGPAHAATASVSSTAQLQSAVNGAAGGDVVEVAGGSYGAVTLTAARSALVTVRPASGQSVTFADLNFGPAASHIRVEGMAISGQVEIAQGSAHHLQLVGSDVRGVAVRAGGHDILVEHNDLHDCGNCLEAASVDPTVHGSPCPSCSPQAAISNLTVRGNRIVNPGTDAFYVGNFRNLVVEGNEIIGVTENGDHSDCLQSTFGGEGLVFRGNYVHDNRCQGFFIKDGRVTDVTVEDNLFAKNTKPCGGGVACDPGSPYTFQLYDTIGVTVRNNTFAQNAGGETFRERSNSAIAFDHNVLYGFGPYDDEGPDYGDYYRQAGVMTEDHNIGGFASTWPTSARGAHDVAIASPSFRDPAQGDYRLTTAVTAGGSTYTPGVTWAAADQRFGRSGAGSPPPPDATPPDTTITSAPTGSTTSTSASFSFSSSEAGSAFQCKLDGGSFVSCASPKSYSGLAAGSHTFSVRASDASGNVDASPATRAWAVTAAPADTVAPRTTITSAPALVTLETAGSITFAVDDAAATSQCRLDGGAWTTCTSPYRMAGLGLGRHTVQVRSTDAAGNVEAPAASVSWTVLALSGGGDEPPPTAPGEAPSVILTAPTADAAVGRTVRLAATATAGVVRVEFWVDRRRVASDARAPYSARAELDGLRSGTHTVSVRAIDALGRGASAAVTVRVSRSGGRARAAAVTAVHGGAKLASAPVGDEATRLSGQGPKRRTVRVTLTRCDDGKGTVVDTVRVRADGRGRLEATRATPRLCVLGLEPPDDD